MQEPPVMPKWFNSGSTLEVISFREILEVFFAVHDPTTPNRQGADVGTQYRSHHSSTALLPSGKSLKW